LTDNNVISAKIAGLDIHGFTSFKQILNKIILKDVNVIPGFAVAINPEKIMLSQRDVRAHQLLESATIRYCDGIGVLKLLEKRCGLPLARLPGCELWEHLMRKTVVPQLPVFILGGTPEVNQNTVQKLTQNIGVNVVEHHDGYFDDEEKMIHIIKESRARIVTVAMGSPKQEEFIVKCMAQYPDCFYMGVGGTYDVFTGEQKRAPDLFRNNGLEWFYRLIKQPTRITRHLRLLKFMYFSILGKI
jgi:UDP-N-acetyl-D-mannosaminouronate:lipid I N-acetyl-D-mannosaminouronosyltransferase